MQRTAIANQKNIKDDADDISKNLLAPLRLTKFNLNHRVVLAPVTRCRAINYVPQPAHVEFYAQRATPRGLLITEAVAVCQQAIGFPHSPGIWTDEQVRAWRKVVQAVHRKGGIIFCQLWHVGRASHTYYQPEGCVPVSSTSKPIPSKWTIRLPEGESDVYAEPRALETYEIPLIVEQFRHAARNARRAGFDGVEIHAGHGYLLDQFFKDVINDRTDEYGGSIANRCRFGLEVLDAVASQFGQERTAIRLSPVIDHLEAFDSDPYALGLHLINELNKRRLAYLHMTEPRFTNKGASGLADTLENCLAFRRAYRGVFMSSGGYTRESGMDAIRSGAADLISFGRLFISNPDLPLRFAIDAGLNPYDRSTFYTHDQVKGYLDYAMLSEKERVDGWSRFGVKACVVSPLPVYGGAAAVGSGLPATPSSRRQRPPLHLSITPASPKTCGSRIFGADLISPSPHTPALTPTA